MKRIAVALSSLALAVTVLVPATAQPAAAEPMDEVVASASSCKEVRAHYKNGVAKTKKAVRKAKRAGYRKPFLCKRAYLASKHLDKNRNKVICERRKK